MCTVFQTPTPLQVPNLFHVSCSTFSMLHFVCSPTFCISIVFNCQSPVFLPSLGNEHIFATVVIGMAFYTLFCKVLKSIKSITSCEDRPIQGYKTWLPQCVQSLPSCLLSACYFIDLPFHFLFLFFFPFYFFFFFFSITQMYLCVRVAMPLE